MFGFALAVTIAGIALVYSGFKGVDPRDIVASVFTGKNPNKLPGAGGMGTSTPSLSPPASLSTAFGLPVVSSSGTCNDNVPLVTYRGIRLQPAAMNAFKAAETRYGGHIMVTGSWRSCAVQSAGYKENPGRFAPPGKSLHPQGLAIDVNPISWVQPRVVKALLQSGWCRPRSDEPWHFSYGTCG